MKAHVFESNQTLQRLLWRSCKSAVAISGLVAVLCGSVQAQDTTLTVPVPSQSTTVLYFDSAQNLLWVEKLTNVKAPRRVVPIQDPALLSKIPFVVPAGGIKPNPSKHFDCTTCPEKRADLILPGMAVKAVYCGRTGTPAQQDQVATALLVEDLTSAPQRLVELAGTGDPQPCLFPKKCHCTTGGCCCW